VGAIVGALAGAHVGKVRIPEDWVEPIAEWPRTIGLLKEVGERLAAQKEARHVLGEVGYFWPVLPLRNVFFLIVVLVHGFRRMVPL
jgi:hypothetical protein